MTNQQFSVGWLHCWRTTIWLNLTMKRCASWLQLLVWLVVFSHSKHTLRSSNIFLLNIPSNSSMTFPSIKCITCYKFPSSWGISQLHYQRVSLWFDTNYIHRHRNEYEPTPRKFQSGVMMSSSFLRKFNCHISAWHHRKYCLSSHFWTSNPIFPGSRGQKHPWETPILLRIPIQKSWKIPMLLSFFMAETSSGNSPTLESL